MEQPADITQERLKEVLDYNPDTGIFRWMVSTGHRAIVGAVAGSLKESGYIEINVDGRRYQAHRLAILYTDGYMPENTVDHKDRVRSNNWRDNLREATQQCQNRNCGMRKDNKSGVKGVSWCQREGKWYAHIVVDGSGKNLGYHASILDAAYVRFAAEQCLGFQDCDLNSSAKQYIDALGGR